MSYSEWSSMTEDLDTHTQTETEIATQIRLGIFSSEDKQIKK